MGLYIESMEGIDEEMGALGFVGMGRLQTDALREGNSCPGQRKVPKIGT